MAAPVYRYHYAALATGSAHSKGSYVQFTAATAVASSRWYVHPFGPNTYIRIFMFDVAIGAGGAEVIQVANIPQHFTEDGAKCVWSLFETDIPAGTRIAGRAQCAQASSTVHVVLHLEDRAITTALAATGTYGADTANTRGTAVTSDATPDVKGAYTQITGATTTAHKTLATYFTHGQDDPQPTVDEDHLHLMDVATGAGGAEVIKIPDIVITNGDGSLTDDTNSTDPHDYQWSVDVPVGTRIAMRSCGRDTGGGSLSAADRATYCTVIGSDSFILPATFTQLGGGYGPLVYTGNPAHTKGAHVQLHASLPSASSRIHIAVRSSATLSSHYLVDVASGAGGAEIVRVANIHHHFTAGGDFLRNDNLSAYDVDLAAGARITCRAQGNGSVAETSVWGMAEARTLTGSSDPVAYGVDTTASRGTLVDPGATAGVYGSYYQLTSATTADLTWGVLQVHHHTASQTGPGHANYNRNLDLAAGAGGAEVIQVADLTYFITWNLGFFVKANQIGAPSRRFALEIASGTRLAARAICHNGSAAGSRELNVSLIGAATSAVYPIQKVTQVVRLVGYDEDAELEEPDPVEPPGGEEPEGQACPGGGTVPTGTDPSAGVSLTDATTPLDYLEFNVGGASPQTVRIAKVAINYGSRKHTRVLESGVVTRELTDETGQLSIASATVTISDHDRVIRGYLETGVLLNQNATLYLADRSTIIAGGTPRAVIHGGIRDYGFPSDFQVELTIEDQWSFDSSLLAGDTMIPKQLIPSQLTDAAPTEALVDTPLPLCYGSLSDELEDEPQGVVPSIFTQTTSAFESLGNLNFFLVCLGVVKTIHHIYCADFVTGGENPTSYMRVPESAYGSWIWAPHKPGWPSANPRFESEGKRYTGFLAAKDHIASIMARENRLPFKLNLCGYENVGDGSGTMIDSLPRQLLHFLINFLINNHDGTGNWATTVPSINGGAYSAINTASFERTKTILDERLGATHAGAFMLGHHRQQQQLNDVIADFLISMGADLGINRAGQIILDVLDREDAAASVVTYVDGKHTCGSPRFNPRTDVQANYIEYFHSRNYHERVAEETAEGELRAREPKDGDWASGLLTLSDSAVITEMNNKIKKSRPQEYAMLRSGTIAAAVANQHLQLVRRPRFHVEIPIAGYRALDLELGEIFKFTSEQGISASGWTDRRLQLRRMIIDLDNESITVVARDIDNLLGTDDYSPAFSPDFPTVPPGPEDVGGEGSGGDADYGPTADITCS